MPHLPAARLTRSFGLSLGLSQGTYRDIKGVSIQIRSPLATGSATAQTSSSKGMIGSVRVARKALRLIPVHHLRALYGLRTAPPQGPILFSVNNCRRRIRPAVR